MRRVVQYEANATLRYCDLCGARYRNTELVQGSDRLWRCKAFCAPEPALIDVDRAAASAHRQREAPPPPYGQQYEMADSWMNEEAIFELVINLAPWPGTSLSENVVQVPGWTVGFANAQACAGEAIIYLHNIVAQAKRPQAWLSAARKKIQELADVLVSTQSTVTTFSGVYSPPPLIGYSVFSQARATLGMLRAYQLLEKVEYLDSAKRAATWLVNARRIDLFTFTRYTVDYGTLNRKLYGPWDLNIFAGGTAEFWAHSTMAAVETLTALIDIAGDGVYGDTLGGNLSSSAADTLSNTISSAMSFWTTPQVDSSTGGAIAGFSAATPFDRWIPSVSTANTRNVWQLQSSGLRNMFDVGWALRSIYSVQGASGLFNDMFNWTMSLAQNPGLPVPTDPPFMPTVANSNNGTFSPKTGITSRATAVASGAVNGNQFLVPSLFGCLAPVLDKPTLDYAKLTWGNQTLRNLSDATQGLGVPATYTFLGLSNQISAANSSSVISVVDAAIFGNCFRYNQSYGGVPNS